MADNPNNPSLYTPTTIDNIHAVMYAINKVQKERCNDQRIIKNYPGIQWKSFDQHRMFPCLSNLTGSCDYGRCIYTTKEGCMKHSQEPYNPIDGNDWPTVSCKDDKDCLGVGYDSVCGTKNKCVPANPYLEWRVDDTTNGLCVMGNSVLKKWCEIPESRAKEATNGVTNVPPFQYDSDKGKCNITKPYCDWMGVSYGIDDKGRPTCYTDWWQSFFENFVLGKTIFRNIKEAIDNIPQIVQKLGDREYAEKYSLIREDFAGPGVNLYNIIWKPESYQLDSSTIRPSSGFFVDEVVKKYPQLILDKNNVKFIRISREQIENNMLKRIYLTLASGQWMSQTISEILNNIKK